MCAQNRESRQGIGEWRQDEVGWSSDKGSRWQGWAASGMTKWFLTLTNCARTTPRSRPGGCYGHCSQEATDSQEVEAEMGQCQSPFAGLTTFTGADTARATSMYKAGYLGEARSLTVGNQIQCSQRSLWGWSEALQAFLGSVRRSCWTARILQVPPAELQWKRAKRSPAASF